MRSTIGIIGSGNIGASVAQAAVAAGHSVVLANTRGPDSLGGLVARLGERARAATPADAARAGDFVLVAVPFFAYRDLPAQALTDRIVLDATNFDPSRDGDPPTELADGTATTSELVQRELPGSRVVKVFNTIFAAHITALARPRGATDRSALPVAGDDEPAKQQVAAFLDSIGWDSVDAGSLHDSWRMALGTPAFVAPYLALGDFARLAEDPGKPAAAADIESLLIAAAR
ncbi:NADPH-dependent F420 reductase [Nocardia sp. CA-135398]|uniref:NADPH-dependent F420 reductase n=1 Tax=Nocardia sp. CA-135398 TaxID=3239977 RepID=UPI003D98AC13